MKKVKITVLKKTFDAELAAEYGVPGLTTCPMLREGQVFYADYAKTKRGRLSTNMPMRLRTARAASRSIMGTGFAHPVLRFASATTDCARSSLSWKRPMRFPFPITNLFRKGASAYDTLCAQSAVL